MRHYFILFWSQARGKEAIVAGFYHDGYEEPLLMLMKRRGVHSGLVVKVETSFHYIKVVYLKIFFIFLFFPFKSCPRWEAYYIVKKPLRESDFAAL